MITVPQRLELLAILNETVCFVVTLNNVCSIYYCSSIVISLFNGPSFDFHVSCSTGCPTSKVILHNAVSAQR